MKTHPLHRLSAAALAAWVLPLPVQAATPAGLESLHIHTGVPQIAEDRLFACTVEWRTDGDKLNHATGMSFLNAAKPESFGSSELTGKKLLTALKDGMVQMDPNLRGIAVNLPQPGEVAIANKAGFSLTTFTVRDYSNQTLGYDVGGRTFAAAGVQIGIDVVYAADVAYLKGFSNKREQAGSQGTIEIRLGDGQPLRVHTDGKSSKQLEQEIAGLLAGAKLSGTPLHEGVATKDTRNNKPFDGSEVQLPAAQAATLSIAVNDPALGVLTRFRFPDENASLNVAEPRFMLAALGAGSVLAIAAFWLRGRRRG